MEKWVLIATRAPELVEL